jgi:23S rRNA (guanine2535-N1)-methyltransferase
VRLSSEIFQRARHLLGGERRLALFDPTCGGAYHLAALGFLHGNWIEAIRAADIDQDALSLAQRNLGLLSIQGIERRIAEIERMLAQYGKESHAGALHSAHTLRALLHHYNRAIPTYTFQANALNSSTLLEGLAGQAVDLVISDIPYGNLSAWHTPGEEDAALPPLQRMLAALLPLLAPGSLVAIAADKRQKVFHPAYHRVDHFSVGKREITFLMP